MSQYEMSGGVVTLDLDHVRQVTGFAVAELQETMNRQLADIRQCLSDSARAAYLAKQEDTPEAVAELEHESYRRLCNANTARENMVRSAGQFADAIQAHFHVTEACKRADCNIVREMDTTE